MSTYDPTIPQDLPPPNVAVKFIQTDFSQYNTVFSNNHTAMNNSNQGKHENVIFQEQINDPDINNTFDAVYSKSVTSNSGTSQQLFLKIPQFLPNDGPNLPQQLTFNVVNVAGPDFQSFLPGGYIFYFGNRTGAPSTVNLVPAPSKLLCAIANPNNYAGSGSPNAINVQKVTESQFIINSPGSIGTDTFSWLAIGKA